ncbi:MAG: hypothetical protein ABI540_05335 [Spartobacteria bacterium]
MTTTFAYPTLTENSAAPAHATLLEPLLIVASCLFWLFALPVTALFCGSVMIYDKIASFKPSSLRLPALRNMAHNPLVLRRTALPPIASTAEPRHATRAFQG